MIFLIFIWTVSCKFRVIIKCVAKMYCKMKNIVPSCMLRDVSLSSITLWFTGRGGERIISLESFVWRTNSSTEGTYSTWAGSVCSTSSLQAYYYRNKFGPSLTSDGPIKHVAVYHLNWDEVIITAATKQAACVTGAKKERGRGWGEINA